MCVCVREKERNTERERKRERDRERVRGREGERKSERERVSGKRGYMSHELVAKKALTSTLLPHIINKHTPARGPRQARTNSVLNCMPAAPLTAMSASSVASMYKMR